jgi:hypothetical protein
MQSSDTSVISQLVLQAACSTLLLDPDAPPTPKFDIRCGTCTNTTSGSKILGTNCQISSRSVKQCLVQHGASHDVLFAPCDATGKNPSMVSIKKAVCVVLLTDKGSV